MKNRASSHLFIIVLILGLEITGYLAVHRAGLLRGYETSIIGAVRDLMMFVPLMMLVIWLSRGKRFAGNWVLFTTAVLLFRHADPVSTLQRSRIQRAQQSRRARGKDGSAPHALHHGELRPSQEAVD